METNKEGAEVPENITDYKNLFDLWLATKKQNAALKEALAELIPIAERTIITVDNEDWRQQWETKRNVIGRAKKLLNKQPQSESDKTE